MEKVMKALRALFGDTSVDQEMTKSNLIQIKDEIDIMLDSLDLDRD